MKDMFIPNLFDLPQRKNFTGGKSVTGTMNTRALRAVISALESTGMIVRQDEPGHFTCHVSGQELLNARKGNKGTYLVRYAQGVTKLMEKNK